MNILIINGPNLNLLGKREPEIYGNISMDHVLENLQREFTDHQINYFQSNNEGGIIDRIQQEDYDALVINPGAYTHYSFAIADALKNLQKTKIEVHISNIYQREEFRKESVTAAYTNGIISGLGVKGYQLALRAILD